MRTLYAILLVVFASTTVFAQSKKDLKEEVAKLNDQLKVLNQTQADLSLAQTKVSSLENQVDELKHTNEQLLNNMNKFLSTSTQQSNSIGKTLEALNKKEAQLKQVRDVYSANDSIAFLVLTDLKKTLGENAQIGVEKGSILIKMDNGFLYGDKADNAKIEEPAKEFVGRISAVINKYESLMVSVQSSGGDWNTNSLRAASISELLLESYNVAPARLKSTITAGGSNVSYVFLHPDFNAFYLDIRDELKSTN
ncbi:MULTISPECIES: hypothetical protein [Galbibacter]|uniref:OmpA family protein n=1 Tax=Galbibacter pacificus TaxID=2996052 RepID=A0ABT6FRA7_9FLAO|nr:hypothetical protein [Galbibacter pacificus]MDG3581932.1 hypothetical protein [Galbibacter pacificus]MDG3585594.1 hypothetical protein [Galbibacter pacificus]